MRSHRHWKLLAAALLALSTSTVAAQNQGRALAFHTRGDSPNDPTYLLSSPSVQKQLALTDAQKSSIQAIRDEDNSGRPFLGKFGGLSADQIQTKLDEHAKENRERVSKILNPEQFARLNEIYLQVVGVTALGFDEVATNLELTADQKAKLRLIAEETGRKHNELNAPNNGRPLSGPNVVAARADYNRKLGEIQKERKNQSMAVLTDKQQAEFTKLQGKKFDTSTIQPNRRSFTSRGKMEAPAAKPSGIRTTGS